MAMQPLPATQREALRQQVPVSGKPVARPVVGRHGEGTAQACRRPAISAPIAASSPASAPALAAG